MKAIIITPIEVASTLAVLVVVLSIGGLLPSMTTTPTAVAQQQQSSSSSQEENATVHTNAPPILNLSTGNKTFYEVNQEIENFNETKMGFPADVYSRPVLIVNKGDNVTIHFFNIETNATDRHSFTLAAPYNIDMDLAGGQNATATFNANKEGVFVFYCKYHLPSMTGELIVVPTTTTKSSLS